LKGGSTMKKWSFLLLCILFLGSSGFAQKKRSLKQERYGYTLEKNRSFLRIPFQFLSNLIVVPVKLNDSDTLNFILDTGVSTIILTDPSIAAKQKMKSVRNVSITGAGEGESLSASVVLSNTIRMNGMVAYNQNIVVLEEDKLALSEYVGIPIHGIFGYDVFNNFVVTIDFALREITLELPTKYKYRKNAGEKYPIVIEHAKPYLTDIAIVDGGHTVPLKLLIDTGAGHAISLNQTANDKIRLPDKVVRVQLGRGLSGIINGSLGRVQKLKLGKLELDNIVASFPDSSSYANKLPTALGRQGGIGCELLRRFKITFNYTDGFIVLKPVKRRLREPFEHNMSGMELIAKGKDYKEFIVEKVVDNSPAFEAGLQEGDQLVIIGNKHTSDLTISEVYKMFQKGEGKEITVLAKRADRVFFTNFFLRRII
jgi:predicted aspartyl protease